MHMHVCTCVLSAAGGAWQRKDQIGLGLPTHTHLVARYPLYRRRRCRRRRVPAAAAVAGVVGPFVPIAKAGDRADVELQQHRLDDGGKKRQPSQSILCRQADSIGQGRTMGCHGVRCSLSRPLLASAHRTLDARTKVAQPA